MRPMLEHLDDLVPRSVLLESQESGLTDAGVERRHAPTAPTTTGAAAAADGNNRKHREGNDRAHSNGTRGHHRDAHSETT
jgi:hypothetical protein